MDEWTDGWVSSRSPREHREVPSDLENGVDAS